MLKSQKSNMDSLLKTTLQTLDKMKQIAAWLHEKKGENIMVMDVRGVSSLTEGLVLATARGVRHAQALADHILERSAGYSLDYLGMEGYRTGTWVLLDLNDVLVHIFQADAREFYNLEGLWNEARTVDICPA